MSSQFVRRCRLKSSCREHRDGFDLLHLARDRYTPEGRKRFTFAQEIRAVLTRIVISGRLRSPSKPKSNKECMKSTFSASVAEQRRANAHLRLPRVVLDQTTRSTSRAQQGMTRVLAICRPPRPAEARRRARGMLGCPKHKGYLIVSCMAAEKENLFPVSDVTKLRNAGTR